LHRLRLFPRFQIIRKLSGGTLPVARLRHS
jgi:hypothetical protein